MWLPLTVAAITLALLLHILNRKKSSNFWEKHGISSIDYSQYANWFELVFGLKTDLDIDLQVYREMGTKKFCGIVESGSPKLFIKDISLFKTIYIKDFSHFVDRNLLFSQSKSTVLLNMLPTLAGAKWREARLSMSPTFTTGKMRKIMDTFNDCGKEWTTWLQAKSGKITDMKQVSSQYAVEVIATTVYGLKAGSIQNPNSEFIKHSQAFGDTSMARVVIQNLAMYFPWIFKWFVRGDTFDEKSMQFFEDITQRTILARESGEVGKRNDFLQLIVDTRKGVLKGLGNDDLNEFEKDAIIKDAVPSHNQCLLENDIANGLGFVFFFGGYHGVAMSITYAAHALAAFPDVQERLREEVDGIAKEDGTVDYDQVNALIYMDMFVSEVLRFYPITSRLLRVCTKSYSNPEIGLNIEKGTEVVVSVPAIHRDPQHYPNPDKFNPEHFTEENKAKRDQYAYLPFGHGPRNCIGMRFAIVEVKTAIAHLIHEYSVEPTANTKFPLKTQVVGHALQIPGKVELILNRRRH